MKLLRVALILLVLWNISSTIRLIRARVTLQYLEDRLLDVEDKFGDVQDDVRDFEQRYLRPHAINNHLRHQKELSN
jgi:hypothetical protein